MNSFIANKLRLTFFVAFCALLLVSTLLSYWYYGVKFSELLQLEFRTEIRQVDQLNKELNSEFFALSSQGQLLTRLFEQPENSTRANTGYAYQIDLMDAKKASLNIITQQEINAHYGIIKSTLSNLAVLNNVDGAFFVWQDASENFQLLSGQTDFSVPDKVLTWLALYSHQSKRLLERPFFSPPFKVAKTDSNKNYMIYSFVAGTKQFFIVLELKASTFKLEAFSDLKANAVLWHNDSGFLVSSNVESQVNKYILTTNPLLAVTSLPLSIQKLIIYQGVSKGGEVQQAMIGDEQAQVATRIGLADGSYQVLLFKPQLALHEKAKQGALKFGILIFLSGLLVVLIFLALILRLLAGPTSKLIEFIEQQSSVFETGTPRIPKGWFTWFEKIQLSFQDNRNLLQNLTEKNRELDTKVKSRTRELMQQTISKDRNIALNRAMMNTIPDSLYYKNVSGGYLGCNKAYEKLIGLSEELLVAKTASDIFTAEKAAEIERVEQIIISTNKVYVDQETIEQKDGSLKLVRWSYSPITNTQGEVLGILGIGQDITEQQASLKKLSVIAEEAERANQVKGEFIANISHEIRTPMNSIIGMLQLLQGSSTDSSQQSYIKIAETSARNLLSVINNILDFSKASADKLEVESEVFSISQVLESSFANSAPKAMQKGVILDTQLGPDFPELIKGDEIKLGQIFTNLIGNAVKFTEQGHVIVSAKLVEQNKFRQTLCFEVKDTGIGIAKSQQKKVFEAFSQADNSVTRQFGGTGLGLTITYQLVELLGGKIELESEEGVGSTFRLTFSFERVEEQPEITLVEAKWCFWDHDEQVRELLKNKLESFGLAAHMLDIEDKETKCPSSVLICRPEALSFLPDTLIEQIKSSKLKLQPVSYTFNPNSGLLSELPHLPVLTSPFNVQSMMLNILQDQWVLPQSNDHQGELTGAKVLVVEDNKVNQQVLSLMLEADHAKVSLANNGAQALSMLAQDSFDIVITDIQMPVMDGLTLIKNIRALEGEVKDIPVVVVSAHTHDTDVSDSLSAGANKHLPKPINKGDLVEVIQSLVEIDNSDAFNGLAQHINLDFLLNQFHHSVPSAKQVLMSFCQSQQQEFQDFTRQAMELDSETVRKKVHSYKGMLGNIGAEQAHKETVKLEQQLKSTGQVDKDDFYRWQQKVNELLLMLEKLQ